MQQHGGTNAYRRTADRSDQGLGKAGDAAQKAPHRRISTHALRALRLLQKITKIIACAKNSHIALNHDTAHGIVIHGGVQGIGHSRIHGFADGVLLVWTVQGNGANTGFGEDQKVLAGSCAHAMFLKV